VTPVLRFAGILLACTASAQSLRVLSEFRRVDPFGEIVPADREGRPREILSPLLARNSHATYRVVVEAPPGKIYYFYVVTNPEKVFHITVYKEMYTRHGGVWIPDLLLEVATPYTSHLPDRYHGIPNQTAESFLVDVWTPRQTPPGRMKIDAQLNVDGRWVIYPMEVRVSDAVIPDAPFRPGRLPPIEARSDAAALGPVREYLCGASEPAGDGLLTVRRLIRRNALEAVARARALEAEHGKEEVARGLLRGLGIDPAAFCSLERTSGPLGPEWFLRGRDYLFRGSFEP
jgi:hypothetical protein